MPVARDRRTRGSSTPHEDVRSFLPTLNDIIHPEVRKLYPGADVPTFGLQHRPDGAIAMRYGRHAAVRLRRRA